MPAWIIGTIHVTEPSAWQQYVERVGATFAPFGGRVLLRGVKAAQYSRAAHGERVVVAEFPDAAARDAWFRSDAYQALIALREQGAEVVLTGYE